jgi:sulfite oxidase
LLTAAAIAVAGAAALHGRTANCDAAAQAAKNLPTISRAEVAKHKTKDTGIYVIYGDGVYDITDFIANHPGGANKIILAAGGNVEPFWKLYAVHQKAVVLDILSSMRIGSLPPDEVVLPKKAGDDDDPYAHVSCSAIYTARCHETSRTRASPAVWATDSMCRISLQATLSVFVQAAV